MSSISSSSGHLCPSAMSIALFGFLCLYLLTFQCIVIATTQAQSTNSANGVSSSPTTTTTTTPTPKTSAASASTKSPQPIGGKSGKQTKRAPLREPQLNVADLPSDPYGYPGMPPPSPPPSHYPGSYPQAPYGYPPMHDYDYGGGQHYPPPTYHPAYPPPPPSYGHQPSQYGYGTYPPPPHPAYGYPGSYPPPPPHQGYNEYPPGYGYDEVEPIPNFDGEVDPRLARKKAAAAAAIGKTSASTISSIDPKTLKEAEATIAQFEKDLKAESGKPTDRTSKESDRSKERSSHGKRYRSDDPARPPSLSPIPPFPPQMQYGYETDDYPSSQNHMPRPPNPYYGYPGYHAPPPPPPYGDYPLPHHNAYPSHRPTYPHAPYPKQPRGANRPPHGKQGKQAVGTPGKETVDKIDKPSIKQQQQYPQPQPSDYDDYDPRSYPHHPSAGYYPPPPPPLHPHSSDDYDYGYGYGPSAPSPSQHEPYASYYPPPTHSDMPTQQYHRRSRTLTTEPKKRVVGGEGRKRNTPSTRHGKQSSSNQQLPNDLLALREAFTNEFTEPTNHARIMNEIKHSFQSDISIALEDFQKEVALDKIKRREQWKHAFQHELPANSKHKSI